MEKIEKKRSLNSITRFYLVSWHEKCRRIIVAEVPEITACQLRVEVTARMHMRARKTIKSARAKTTHGGETGSRKRA